MDEPLEKNATPAEASAPEEAAAAARRISLPPEAKSLIPSAALIGVGLLLESELLVGVALGTGIVIASRWLPQGVRDTVRPIVSSTLEAWSSATAKTSEMLGEAAQRVERIITRQAPPEEAATGPEGEPEAPEDRLQV